MPIQNPPTDYDKLPLTVLASKSGKTPFDAYLLAVLTRIAIALEKANA